ncbi:hypothetical protein EV214_10948 [Marinisporobacter balticus]|uniref:Uncharacterized protein n=1 Tax=Marinisporobacter balticus TaxID=2018667 RepID=A0A4R2KND3_9FIRM|nr:hypothetical protein EV214_10948 [Marinisporobacter balticus]
MGALFISMYRTLGKYKKYSLTAVILENSVKMKMNIHLNSYKNLYLTF